MRAKAKRILLILNHRTLLPAELPVLESLGFEVFTPSATPDEMEFGSATSFDKSPSTLAPDQLRILTSHNFYSEEWSEQVRSAINDAFGLVITSVYKTPLIEALKHFDGPVIARVFGREEPKSYAPMFAHYRCDDLIRDRGGAFVLAQAYDELSEVEPDYLSERMRTAGCSIPEAIWRNEHTWRRASDDLLFLCPRISTDYYGAFYLVIKKLAAQMPHKIIGRQFKPTADPAVLGFVSDDDLLSLYRTSAAFLYVSHEPRHLHYTPLEAAIVGLPVLYLRGSLMSRLVGRALPGECSSLDDMQSKARRLSVGDSDLASAVTEEQDALLKAFQTDLIRDQWHAIFSELGVRRSAHAVSSICT
jgi:hypothetical protein